MEPVDVIKAARELIADEKNWIKRNFHDGEAHCAFGAVSRAASSSAATWEATSIMRNHTPGGRMLVSFNDAPETTHQDVLNVFDKALAELGGLA